MGASKIHIPTEETSMVRLTQGEVQVFNIWILNSVKEFNFFTPQSVGRLLPRQEIWILYLKTVHVEKSSDLIGRNTRGSCRSLLSSY